MSAEQQPVQQIQPVGPSGSAPDMSPVSMASQFTPEPPPAPPSAPAPAPQQPSLWKTVLAGALQGLAGSAGSTSFGGGLGAGAGAALKAQDNQADQQAQAQRAQQQAKLAEAQIAHYQIDNQKTAMEIAQMPKGPQGRIIDKLVNNNDDLLKSGVLSPASDPGPIDQLWDEKAQLIKQNPGTAFTMRPVGYDKNGDPTYQIMRYRDPMAARADLEKTKMEMRNDNAYQMAQFRQELAKQMEDYKFPHQLEVAKQRAESISGSRRLAVIDPETGEARYVRADQADKTGAAPLAGGQKAMAQHQQLGEMNVASQKLRSAITNLDRPFTTDQIAKLTMAMRSPNETVAHDAIDSLLGSQQLTQKQQDFVVWAGQMNERAMALRSASGIGQQGSDKMRAAIAATLPSAKDANTALMLKKLDAFDNQVSILQKGIPVVKGQNAAPIASGMVTMKAPNGQTKPVPADQVEHFKSLGAVVVK